MRGRRRCANDAARNGGQESHGDLELAIDLHFSAAPRTPFVAAAYPDTETTRIAMDMDVEKQSEDEQDREQEDDAESEVEVVGVSDQWGARRVPPRHLFEIPDSPELPAAGVLVPPRAPPVFEAPRATGSVRPSMGVRAMPYPPAVTRRANALLNQPLAAHRRQGTPRAIYFF